MPSETLLVWERARDSRKATLLTVAAEMKASGFDDVSEWRKKLSERTAQRCGLPASEKNRIYAWMASLQSDGLTEIRVACLGVELAARVVKRHTGRKSIDQMKADHERNKAIWGPRFQLAIAKLMERKAPLFKTDIVKLACIDVADSQRDQVYRILDRFSIHELHAFGYPRKGEYTPLPALRRRGALPCGGSALEKGADVSEASEENVLPVNSEERIRHFEKLYDDAVEKLPKERRNVKGLAEALRMPAWQVAGFVSRCETLAKKLTDGEQVYGARFLFTRS